MRRVQIRPTVVVRLLATLEWSVSIVGMGHTGRTSGVGD
jgi:hypothetical protein